MTSIDRSENDRFWMPSNEGSGSFELLSRWYHNIPNELAEDHLTGEEKAFFQEYYREAGLLQAWRKPFFTHHFVRSFFEASEYLLHRPDPVVLDLGAGTGTQSLFFALRGAKVIALDLDAVALRILEKRRRFYERLAGRSLNITVLQKDAFDVEFKALGGIDSIYSMFAFNMMQPSDLLLDHLVEGLSPKARFAVIDGNSESWLTKVIPSRRRKVLSPSQFSNALNGRGFRIASHHSAVVLPPILWAALPSSLLRPIDSALGKSWLAALSHQILAQREG